MKTILLLLLNRIKLINIFKMNKDELRETTEKMNYMDDLLKKNIFNNPLRDVQLNMRNELIDFRTTLQKNFSELEKYIVDTCLI